MPPQVALLVTFAGVLYLLWRETRQTPELSRALWIPVLWIWITGSRFTSQWFAIWGVPLGGGGDASEGSPLDAAVFLLLILAGFEVLRRRRIRWSEIARENTWLAIFFVYCFIAIAWSDSPFMAFKRWIKILGHPVMALLILTEVAPQRAVISVLKRMAFVLVPFSITLIKYYPHIGRGFDGWTGEAFNQGVNLNKNELGYVCLISGVFFAWNLLGTLRRPRGRERNHELILSIGFLILIGWLLHMARSSTSLACTMLGVGTMIAVGRRFVSKRHIGTIVVVTLLTLALAESLFGIYAKGVQMLGRDPSLTDRTEVWADALALVSDPVFGAGFESFWYGERLEKLWAKWWWQPNQAHNGYIEVYLNLGAVGILILIGLVISTFHKIRVDLLNDMNYGRFRLAFLFVVLAYNYTEATFKGVHLVWLVFHIIALDYRAFYARLAANNDAAGSFDGPPASVPAR